MKDESVKQSDKLLERAAVTALKKNRSLLYQRCARDQMLENIYAIVDYTLGQREGMDEWEGYGELWAVGRNYEGVEGWKTRFLGRLWTTNYITVLFTETLQ